MELSDVVLDKYMQKCVELAKRAGPDVYKSHVGAIVLSSSGEIVGEGYRHLMNSTNLIEHAERMALDQARDAAIGGTVISTEIPCERVHSNQLLQPCSTLLVERGIKHVVVGTSFPDQDLKDSILSQFTNHGVTYYEYLGWEYDIISDLVI